MRTYNIYENIPTFDQFVQIQDATKFLECSKTGKYVLFKYSKETQFSKAWDDVTLNARGIVFDQNTGECVMLPFTKFFNLEENEYPQAQLPAPITEAEVLFKEDGSMCAIWLGSDGQLMTSTPGSIESPQALWAREWLRNHSSYDKILSYFLDGKVRCLICEVIYEGSRVVLNYSTDELILLAAQIPSDDDDVTPETLSERPYSTRKWIYANHQELKELGDTFQLTTVKQFTFDDIDTLRSELRSAQNLEGFVLHYPSTGFRLKVKSAWYLVEHKMTQRISPILLRDALTNIFAKNGENRNASEAIASLRNVVTSIPEEYSARYEEFLASFSEMATHIISLREEVYNRNFEQSTSRKEFALGVISEKVPSIIGGSVLSSYENSEKLSLFSRGELVEIWEILTSLISFEEVRLGKLIKLEE